MATIHDETTPQLFTSILSEQQFKIKGRLFKYEQTLKSKPKNTLVCKCLGVDDNLEYDIKIIKLNLDLLETKPVLDKNNISDTCVGRHQLGEWKFSEIINKLSSSLVVNYEISEIIGDEIILLSEYRGIDLETYGNNKIGTLYLCEVLQIFIDIVNALLLIHKHDIIHRDIKPSNIFINYKTQQTTYAPIDLIQVALGDLPGYITPESKNVIYSIKSDIWSLARSMIWLLFFRNNMNSYNTINSNNALIMNDYNEFEKKIVEEDLNNNEIILKFIENGNLENDIDGWRQFITILKDMFIEGISLNQILKRIFIFKRIEIPINLKQQFDYLCDHFKNNRSIQFFYTINEIYFPYLNENLKKDREIVLECILSDESVLETVENGLAFKYADEKFKNDRKFVLEAVKQHSNLFYYADESLRNDREFVLEAVKQYFCSSWFVDELFKNQRESTLEAIKDTNILFIFNTFCSVSEKLIIFVRIIDYIESNNILFIENKEDFVVNSSALELLATFNISRLGCVLLELLTNDIPVLYKNIQLPSNSIEEVLTNEKLDTRYEIKQILFACINRMMQTDSSIQMNCSYYKNIILKIINILENNNEPDK